LPILKTLLYFSIFDYPLTREEIFNFSKIESQEEVDSQLDYLLEKKVVFKFENYYSMSNDASKISRRQIGNKMATDILPKAKRMSRFISKFPFVENVSISGSLSKNYYDDEGDFDFFIMTTPNKLWISRTLLILYKKIFLLNSKKYFCLNYFISSNHLAIAERNRFTATEIVTLLPVYGKDLFYKFLDSNTWATDLFPNKKLNGFKSIETIKKPLLSRLLERLFNTKFGDYTDEALRKLTLKKWKISFDHMDEEDFKIAMKSTKNVSKHHPQNYQKKVIQDLEKAYKDITEQYNLEFA